MNFPPEILVCRLGYVSVTRDIVRAEVSFHLKPYGTIYKVHDMDLRNDPDCWKRGLREAVDMLSAFA